MATSNTKLNAERVAQSIRANGGITVDPVTGLCPKIGFAVSIDGERSVPLSVFSARHLHQYIQDRASELAGVGAHLGAWVDGTQVILDVSVVLDNPSQAASFARRHGQRAFYDLARGKTLRIRRNHNGKKG